MYPFFLSSFFFKLASYILGRCMVMNYRFLFPIWLDPNLQMSYSYIICAQLSCVLFFFLVFFPVTLLHEWANPDRTGHGLGHSQNPWGIQTLYRLQRQERNQCQTLTLCGFCKEILACLASNANMCGTLSSVHCILGRLHSLCRLCFSTEHTRVLLMFESTTHLRSLSASQLAMSILLIRKELASCLSGCICVEAYSY